MFRQMYLISKQAYLACSNPESPSRPLQINHTKVGNGGRVEIFNSKGCDENDKSSQWQPNKDPSIAVSPTPEKANSQEDSTTNLEPVEDRALQKPSNLKHSTPTALAAESELPSETSIGPPIKRPTTMSENLPMPRPVVPMPNIAAPRTYQEVRVSSPMPQSQVFYPPGSIVSQGPIPGQKNNSKEEVVLPQDELMELAPEITTRDGKMDNFSASILDMLGESRRVMESFIAEARNDIASYNELALRNSSEINQLISEEKKSDRTNH